MIGRVVYNEVKESWGWWKPGMKLYMKNILEHLTEIEKSRLRRL